MSTVGNWRGPNIVKDSLILYLEGTSPNSYSPYFAGTTWKDISTFNYNVTLINGPTYSSLNGGSIVFDGVNDYGTIPYNANFNLSNTDYTLETWFNSNSFSSGQILLSKDTNGLNYDWGFYIANSTTLAIYSNGTATNVTATVPPMSTNQWYHYVITSISGTIRIYLNSILFQTQSMSTSNASQVTVTIGCAGWNNPNTFNNGRIATLRVYRKGLTISEIQQNYLAKLNQLYDSDAVNFINAASISGSTEQYAINQLVIGLKTYGLWTKMRAIYPFIGGTATTHKFNLKDPRDLDAAYRLNFVNGWGHSSNGILGNGLNTYANTFLVPSSILSQDNSHISIYSRTDSIGDYIDMGANNGPSTVSNAITFQLKWSDGICYSRVNAVGTTSFTNTNSQGFYITSRISSSTQKLYKNTTIYSSSTLSTGNSIYSIHIGAWNNAGGGTSYYTNRQYAFASIGDGLTDTEAANFYTIVQNFNTTLGRQV